MSSIYTDVQHLNSVLGPRINRGAHGRRSYATPNTTASKRGAKPCNASRRDINSQPVKKNLPFTTNKLPRAHHKPAPVEIPASGVPFSFTFQYLSSITFRVWNPIQLHSFSPAPFAPVYPTPSTPKSRLPIPLSTG
jgi:hypothetical protein